MNESVVLAWKGGKESALALWRLKNDPRCRVAGLLAVLDENYGRVHPLGATRIVVAGQAEALGLPLIEATVPRLGGARAFAEVMGATLGTLKSKGVEAVAFGDLFAEDARALHERVASTAGLAARFPLWRENPDYVCRSFIREGYQATVIGINSTLLPPSLLGAPYDESFVSGLPDWADPCGEKGEFHCFVHDGPAFRYALPMMAGVHMERCGYYFADLLPLANKVVPLAVQRAALPPA